MSQPRGARPHQESQKPSLPMEIISSLAIVPHRIPSFSSHPLEHEMNRPHNAHRHPTGSSPAVDEREKDGCHRTKQDPEAEGDAQGRHRKTWAWASRAAGRGVKPGRRYLQGGGADEAVPNLPLVNHASTVIDTKEHGLQPCRQASPDALAQDVQAGRNVGDNLGSDDDTVYQQYYCVFVPVRLYGGPT
ncbi:hypothetical protein LX32DRAFT_87211 [Colletotrichum zoysiae]|uniref:Uncharacterized protein n=1 Tax=Colletotrichum zoysiae TaxID=1216348 RepID=A0AAD9M8E8_9PEZI|nr:hypothetical protein LX32DRAFT_87211 [Colletotrichum zoysiae]